jgi:hypothetical protein
MAVKKSHDSSVGIALGYGLDDWGSRVRFPAGTGNFSLHHRVQNGSGTHPASSPMGTKGSFPEGKAAGREADHSPPSRAEVKNAWSYTSTPQNVFMAWCLAKHRDNFTLSWRWRFILWFSAFWHRSVLEIVTNVSEKLAASIFRVKGTSKFFPHFGNDLQYYTASEHRTSQSKLQPMSLDPKDCITLT